MDHFVSRFALACLGIFVVAGCATMDRPPGLPPTSKRDEIVKLQVFLDGVNFGPGVVDGRDGEFTAKALSAYERVMGRKPDLSEVVPYTSYMVTADDLGRIGPLGTTPEEMAAQKRLPYTSLTELVAERFHTTRAFVTELNPGAAIDTLGAGAVLKVPNVRRPFRVGNFPSGYSAASSATATTRRVVVDTPARMLSVIDSERLIAIFPITPGSAEHPAPIGEWKVAGVAPWPWFRWDEGVLKRGERTQTYFQLPPGVNSPVGILWAGLNRPGIGIHGSPEPETIGRSGSHGCIRLANWDAATFYTLVARGTPVSIR